ncbi:MAG: tetratricopeptide repeat protein [Phycisphaerae bacterium]|jgi:predicted DNA-binding WGR domain protein
MRPKQLEQWQFLFIGMAIVGIVLWPLSQWLTTLRGSFIMAAYFAAAVGIFGILQVLAETIKNLNRQQEKIEQLSESLTANKNLLEQISQEVRLSEAAKTICYRDTDRQLLRASVIERLHQQDFEATYAMIDNIERRPEYKQLAADLRLTADRYRDATEQDRVSQVINYIDRLLEQRQWANAETQIERLIKKYPDSEKAGDMSEKLFEKKEKRKRELLDEWDTAVKKSDIDRSLEVLHELDLYLTPSEGLALQEAASEIFKNKLHNMGVQFSLAVSDKQWDKALETGQTIIREFPNSKMADEIRNKKEILQELAKKQ